MLLLQSVGLMMAGHSIGGVSVTKWKSDVALGYDTRIKVLYKAEF